MGCSKQLLIYVPLIGLLLAGLYLRLQGITHSDHTAVGGKPFVDDSFYYFSLGKNAAAGQGAQIDALHPTTGFQPLWGFLNIVAYTFWPDQGIWAVQLIGTFVGLLTGAAIYGFTWHVTKTTWGAVLNSGLWLFAPQTVLHNLGGMETGLAVLAHVLIFYSLYKLYQARTYAALCVSGVMAGIGFLAWVDTSLLLVFIGSGLFLFPPLGISIQTRLRSSLLWSAWVLLPIIPWLMFVLALGKSPVPESGTAVRTLAQFQVGWQPPPITWMYLKARDPDFNEFYNYFGRNAVWFTTDVAGQIYLFDGLETLSVDLSSPVKAPLTLVWFLTAIGVLLLLTLALLSFKRGLQVMTISYTGWLITMIAAYTFVITVTWFYRRYALPLAESFSVLGAVLILFYAAKLPGLARLVAMAGLLIIAGMILIQYQKTYQENIAFRWILHGEDTREDDGFYRTATWLNANLPQDTLIGAFQSGLLGYYARAPLINLDGKVNAEAHEAMEARSFWLYVCRTGLEYIVDWPLLVTFLLKERNPEGTWREENLILIHEIPVDFANPFHVYQVNRANCPA